MLKASVRVCARADRKGVRVQPLAEVDHGVQEFYDLASPRLRTNLVSETLSNKTIF